MRTLDVNVWSVTARKPEQNWLTSDPPFPLSDSDLSRVASGKVDGSGRVWGQVAIGVLELAGTTCSVSRVDVQRARSSRGSSTVQGK